MFIVIFKNDVVPFISNKLYITLTFLFSSALKGGTKKATHSKILMWRGREGKQSENFEKSISIQTVRVVPTSDREHE